MIAPDNGGVGVFVFFSDWFVTPVDVAVNNCSSASVGTNVVCFGSNNEEVAESVGEFVAIRSSFAASFCSTSIVEVTNSFLLHPEININAIVEQRIAFMQNRFFLFSLNFKWIL